MMRRILLSFFFLLAMGPSAHAGPPFPLRENLEFDANSPYALVVFEAEAQVVVPEWRLALFAFDVPSRRWTYGLTRGWANFGHMGASAQRRFYASLVRPAGTYAINHIETQGFWDACFNGGTKAFTLEAGRINFIGTIDPSPTLRDIASSLPPVSRGGAHLIMFNTPRLSYVAATERAGWESDVASFVATQFPRVHAEIVAPVPVDVTFEPSHSMVAGTICEKY